MAVRIVTYSSPMSFPPTMFIGNTLLQNTQMKLSYTHIHFTNNVKAISPCDILVVDGNFVPMNALEEAKKVHSKTILWSRDVINSAVWLIEKFSASPTKSYIIVVDDSTSIEERDFSSDIDLEASPSLPDLKVEPQKNSTEDYLEDKFSSLEKKKPVESIFSRLHLSKNL
ncbi:uncharacterized protein Eint_051350 [Encephalitozoon intestinalis ATCC 50506]|uniref:Uncharacterized protein n=1 Tax=Encephalitozoon intestinalis (strain ATCC 50506) TaxID=876142 RepID=E0S6Z6_ENCIT|nr:uncharacterized protein Eint_051350 [Encephalitozoon intestinalis ATCC 50506]ADM11582.1 hypothetical protein Eint_051350 [Encephalitozoon intestinalis ATCC 50506]UTX45300.1 hypothetical protein GPK93_05g08460 [Encephalitozoon intestinalis]